MNDREAFDVLIVRAVEAADAGGALIPFAARRAAAADAVRAAGVEPPMTGRQLDRYVVRRAQNLIGAARTAVPSLAGWNRPPYRAWVVPLLVVVALLLGLASNAIGDRQRLDLLTTPLAWLIGWNLLAYCVLMFRWVAARLRGGSSTRSRWSTRWRIPIPRPDSDGPLREAIKSWLTEGRRLHDARSVLGWHAAAAALAIGTVGGMYLRGLGIDFTAAWESTFLDEHAVHRIFAFLFAPGAALFGLDVPDIATFAGIRSRAGTGGGPAGQWIHLYAAATFVLVVLPRGILATIAAIRAGHWRRNFPIRLEDDYYRRLAAGSSAQPRAVVLLPCSFQPEDSFAERARPVLERALQTTADIRIGPSIGYGELAQPAAITASEDRVIVFSLATTPEREVHGAVLEQCRPLAVLIDEAAYTRRAGGDATTKRRVEERRSAWRSFLRTYGIDPMFVSTDSIASGQ